MRAKASGLPESAPGSAGGADAGAPEPSPRTSPRGAAVWAAPAVVWGVWALLVLGNLAFVYTYGSDVPYMDDWEWVPAVTGAQPLTLPWVWAQLNDHRHPLAKVLLLGLYKLSGGDFRAALYANIVCLAVLAFVLLRVAKRLRGRTSYLDAFLPLAVLNIDQEIIFLGLGVSTVPAAMLAGLTLSVIAYRGTRLTVATAALAGGCVVLLALIGTVGLALVPALALWLIYLGVLMWRSGAPHGGGGALLVWGCAAISLILIPLYFLNFRPYAQIPPSPGLSAALRTTLEFLSMSVGQAGHLAAPPSIPPLVGLAVVLLSLGSALLLLKVWWTRPGERARALGLLLFLLAVGSLAFGVGLARSGLGPGTGYAPRYVLLAMPVLCCLYFIWELYGPPRVGRLVPAGLLLLLIILLPFNVGATLQCGSEHGRQMAAVEQAIDAGSLPHTIAERHGKFLYDQMRSEQLTRYLCLLREAGIGRFRHLEEDVDLPEEVRVAVKPSAVHRLTWEDGTGRAEGEDSYLEFNLPKIPWVSGIRIKCAYEGAADPPSLRVRWRRSAQNDYAGGSRQARFDLGKGPGEQTRTAVVNNAIDQFRIYPDTKPCVFKVSEITLVLQTRAESEKAYKHMVGQIQAVVGRTLPPGATVLVVSHGEDGLLELGGRRAWHFPQYETGEWSGEKPADSAAAIAHLTALRTKGADFLLFPSTECWWLEHYKEFKEYLETHYRAIHRGDHCIIFDLRK